MKKYLLTLASMLLLSMGGAQAATITGATLTTFSIPFETKGTPTGTTVQFTLSGAANVEIDIFRVATTVTQVAAISAGNLNGAQNIFWNGLWFLGGDIGRQDGNYQISISATDSGGTTSVVIPTLLQITSVDIHNVNVVPSLDANQNPAFPYLIQHALAKDSLVTVRVKNSLGTIVRTVLNNQPEFNENVATNTLTWNGLGDDGHPVPLGIYTVTLDANDANSTDVAIERTRTIAVTSLASLNTDPQQLFDTNVFVYPNPVRGGQATFQAQAVRDNASISFKIYTISGDLVRDETIGGVTTGNIVNFVWDAKNQSGKKVGRGLYYYVARESDPQGTLQTVKKMAVIP